MCVVMRSIGGFRELKTVWRGDVEGVEQRLWSKRVQRLRFRKRASNFEIFQRQ